MNSTALLVATDLYKRFGQGKLMVNVLQGVHFSIKENETAAIIGASGSGKSTLIHLLGGLDVPDQGTVAIQGRVFSDLSERERGRLRNQSLSFVYQFHHLLMEFSAQENVAMPLLIRRLDRDVAMERAAVLLEQVGLGARLQHKPGELSGGERQRVAIARALVTEPRCILADEPTGNLDEYNASQVLELILQLKQLCHTSLVIVTHNPALLGRIDHLYELRTACLHPLD